MSADSEFPTDTALAMVATSSTRLPDATKILAVCGIKPSPKKGLLGSLFGGKGNAVSEHEWNDRNLVFPFRDAQIAVSLMPAPIPWSQLEGPCATAWWWDDATMAMRRHKYHFLVAIIGGTIEPVIRRILLTRIVSAVVADTDAIGIYWGEGTLVHEPADFLERARTASAEDIPATLWLDVRVEPNENQTFRCFTTGMRPLGFLEIEVEQSSLKPDELLASLATRHVTSSISLYTSTKAKRWAERRRKDTRSVMPPPCLIAARLCSW